MPHSCSKVPQKMDQTPSKIWAKCPPLVPKCPTNITSVARGPVCGTFNPKIFFQCCWPPSSDFLDPPYVLCLNLYQPRSLAKQGDNALGSVRLSVHLSVRPSVSTLKPEQQPRLNHHYQCKVSVCL